jgi:hypothetical protein
MGRGFCRHSAIESRRSHRLSDFCDGLVVMVAESARGSWPRRNLQHRQHRHRFIARCPAHLTFRPQRYAERGALRMAEQSAAQVVIQLHTRHAGRFAVRHAGDG